jgi:hypothetical protein
MRIYIEISKAAADKLVELARIERRSPRQQAELLLERAIQSASTTREEESHREELVHADQG